MQGHQAGQVAVVWLPMQASKHVAVSVAESGYGVVACAVLRWVVLCCGVSCHGMYCALHDPDMVKCDFTQIRVPGRQPGSVHKKQYGVMHCIVCRALVRFVVQYRYCSLSNVFKLQVCLLKAKRLTVSVKSSGKLLNKGFPFLCKSLKAFEGKQQICACKLLRTTAVVLDCKPTGIVARLNSAAVSVCGHDDDKQPRTTCCICDWVATLLSSCTLH